MHRNINAGDGVALPAYSLRLDASGAYLARPVRSFNPAFELRLVWLIPFYERHVPSGDRQ